MSFKRIVIASAIGATIIVAVLWRVPLAISQVRCSALAEECVPSVVRSYGFPFRLRESSETEVNGVSTRRDTVSPSAVVTDFLAFFLLIAALGIMQSSEVAATFVRKPRQLPTSHPPRTF